MSHRFLDDQNQEECQKKWRKVKRSSKQGKIHGLQNFAAQKGPLRKWPLAAKQFRSPQVAAAKSGLRCEIAHWLWNDFAALRPPATKIFAAAKHLFGTRVPFRSFVPPFRSCKMGYENVFIFFSIGCEIIFRLRNGLPLWNHLWTAKWAAKMFLFFSIGCEIIFWLRNGLRKCFFFPFGLRNPPLVAKSPFCCEMISKLQNGCEMISKLRNGLEKCFFFSLWLRNDLQASKWLRNHLQPSKLTCEMEGGLRKHLTKPREVVKMPIEPRYHASKDESPLIEITHTKPLTPLLTSLKPSEPIAPTESSS